MNPSTTRRVGASLIALISSPSCSASTRTACRAAAASVHQHRSLSWTPRRRQEPSPAQAQANAQQVAHDLSPSDESEPLRNLTDGLDDPPPVLSEDEKQVDWTRSYHGLSASPFTSEQSAILQQDINFDDIEIKPDGIVYLPEIKYRRILNKAFGPGGWGLAPRGETIVTQKVVTREYGLVAGGRLISIARGEQQYFDPDGIPTATEGCKSNALMRCCKDLGIASELWDPRFIKRFMAERGKECMVEHVVTKKRRRHWMRKDDELKYPLREISLPGAGTSASSSSGNGNGSVTKAATPAARKAFGNAAATKAAGATTPSKAAETTTSTK